MTTWPENLARRDRGWLAWAEIEGVGSADGLWRFSTYAGWYLAAEAGYWFPHLVEPPNLLSSRVDYIGGGTTQKSGSVEIQIVDVGEALTELLRIDGPAATAVRVGQAQSDGSLAVPVGHGLQIGQVVWVGAEAQKVTELQGGNSVGVTRAFLGTTQVAHEAGTSIYTHPNFLRNRPLRVYLAPLDAVSDTERRLVAEYLVDGLSYDEAHGAWVLAASLREPFMTRRSPAGPIDFEVTGVFLPEGVDTGSIVSEPIPNLDPFEASGTGIPQPVAITRADQDDGEVMIAEVIRGSNAVSQVLERSHAGTQQDELEPGRFRRVLSAKLGDFRRKNGIAVVRIITNGETSDHVVDILLHLLTSSAVEGDGLYFANNGPGLGVDDNFSTLPVGYGVGVPQARIDWDSFFEVRERAPDFRLPNFIWGQEPKQFSEAIDEMLLKPFGLILTSEAGTLRLRLPRLPLAGDSSPLALDPSNILARQQSPGVLFPRVEIQRDVKAAVSSIVFSLGHEERKVQIDWSGLGRLFDPRSLYDLDTNAQEYEVLGADADEQEIWEALGIRRLWRTFRPPTVVSLDADVGSIWDLRLDQSVRLTLPGVVNPRTGQRGFVDADARLVEREERFEVDRGVYLSLVLHVTPSARLARIAPAAGVLSVATNTVTTQDNRYTLASSKQFPDEDASTFPAEENRLAFQVGDVLRLINRAGADVGLGTETVVAVATNQLELSGNFSGNLAAGLVLVYADAGEAVPQQTDRFAFMADRTTNAVGGTSLEPVFWGEP